MRTSLFIAYRYLFTKKSHTIINVISIISLISVVVCTAALFIVLSIFNGLQNYVAHNFNSFNADLAITPKTGKTFIIDNEQLEKIKQIKGVHYLSEVVADIGVVTYEDRQLIVQIKGVAPDYYRLKHLDTLIFNGEYLLEVGENSFALLGVGVANRLQCAVSPMVNNALTIYYPNRNKKFSASNPSQNLNIQRITPFGVFLSETEYDASFIFVPLAFARNLMNYTDEVTSIEIGTLPNANTDNISKAITEIIGDDFYIKNAYQQEEDLYKIMQAEKLAIYLILTFIFLVASFNIVGMIAILVLDKKRDISVLYSLGADNRMIRRIFMLEGMLIALAGVFLGLLIGSIFCWLQTTFHLISFGDGTYILNYYPVKIYGRDIFFIVLTVVAISFPATYIPVLKISEKLLKSSIPSKN